LQQKSTQNVGIQSSTSAGFGMLGHVLKYLKTTDLKNIHINFKTFLINFKKFFNIYKCFSKKRRITV
jgi:hypothetical protein